MTGHFISKEIVENVVGPKFIITFIICTVLILTSVYAGYELYKEELEWHATATSENEKALDYAGSYGNLKSNGAKVIRQPSRMSIFVKGVDSAIGKAATVDQYSNIVLRDSRFGLNPIFAAFGELDLTFIVTMILSLFAVLFSYNAISGEREQGTLRIVLSNSIGRAAFIVGKSIGGLVTLLLTFLVPFLLALLMLMLVFGVNFTVDEGFRLALIIAASCIYLSVFYMIGMTMSALTRNSIVSFLLCLFVWVLSVAVIPKFAIEASGRMSDAPSIDKLESERASLRREYYSALEKLVPAYFDEEWDGNFAHFSDAFSRAWSRAQEDASAELAKKEEPLVQNYERKHTQLLVSAESFARISPTSCFTFAASRLAHTDAALRQRFIKTLRRYRERYIDFVDMKMKEEPDKAEGGVNVRVVNGRPSVTVPSHELDLTGMPEYSLDHERLTESVAATAPDLGILAIEFLLFFVAAFVAFLRYDVR